MLFVYFCMINYVSLLRHYFKSRVKSEPSTENTRCQWKWTENIQIQLKHTNKKCSSSHPCLSTRLTTVQSHDRCEETLKTPGPAVCLGNAAASHRVHLSCPHLHIWTLSFSLIQTLTAKSPSFPQTCPADVDTCFVTDHHAVKLTWWAHWNDPRKPSVISSPPGMSETLCLRCKRVTCWQRFAAILASATTGDAMLLRRV